MFNIWKQHVLISYYSLAMIISCISASAYWLGYLEAKLLSLLLCFCLGLAFFQIAARMMIIFLTACVSFIALGIYYHMVSFSLLPTIFGMLTAMLTGYSLTFSTGRWFMILYALSLAIVAGIAVFFGLFLPAT